MYTFFPFYFIVFCHLLSSCDIARIKDHFFSFLFHCFLSLAQFMRYCKDQGSGAKVLAEFIDDVATFRVRTIDRFCYMPWRFPSYRGCGDFRVKFECGVIEALF
jgi:hypothetical protein